MARQFFLIGALLLYPAVLNNASAFFVPNKIPKPTNLRTNLQGSGQGSAHELEQKRDPKLLRGDPNWRQQAPNFVFRTLDDVRNAGMLKEAETKTWESRRYITRKDGFGFSFHHTVLRAGESTLIHYKNHVEAVLVFSGTGEIELCHEGQKEGEGFAVFKLEPGSFYGLGGQERHFLRASKDGDMHVACAFNPPVDGGEDHNSDGVYPAIGEDGIKRYQYDDSAIPILFKPPVTLANGSIPKEPSSATKCLPRKLENGINLRQVQKGDGKLMWSLAKEAGLDLNSAYMYNLFCLQFKDTCLLALNESNDPIGYVLGYKAPSDPDTLFVWQIGVVPEYQRRGIAHSMLTSLVDHVVGVSNLQATVTPSNQPSTKLFQKFAEQRQCEMTIEKDWIADEDFPLAEPHEAEDLLKIGPL